MMTLRRVIPRTNRTARGATRREKALRRTEASFSFHDGDDDDGARTSRVVCVYSLTAQSRRTTTTTTTGKRCDAQRRTRTEVYRRQRRRKTSRERTRHENDDTPRRPERERRRRTNEAVPTSRGELCNFREDSMSRRRKRNARSPVSLEMCSDTCCWTKKDNTLRRTLKCAKS